MEIIGRPATAFLTETHADVVGLQAVNAAAQKSQSHVNANPDSALKSMYQDIGNALGELSGAAIRSFASNVASNGFNTLRGSSSMLLR
jgi:hypothetical protein